VLYYNSSSIWSSAALIALEEKGYGKDDVDLKEVDLVKAENYAPSFLRLNSKATVPTLVVPLEKTLSEHVASRYKALTDTKTIIEFLDKSRSHLSTTNSTSEAPMPALAPATVVLSSTYKRIVDELLHSEDADPNNLLYVNARDNVSLRALGDALSPVMKGKVDALSHYISEAQAGNIRASEKVTSFWGAKKDAAQVLLEVYENAKVPESAQSAEYFTEYFKVAKASWEVGLVRVLNQLNEEIIGPYALGEQYSLADPHLTAWLTRVISLAGGTYNDTSAVAIEKLVKHIGVEQPLVLTKLAVYWDAVKERPSWKVYADGLH